MRQTSSTGISLAEVSTSSTTSDFSAVQLDRLHSDPCLPDAFKQPVIVVVDKNAETNLPEEAEKLKHQFFPYTWGQPILKLNPDINGQTWETHEPLRLGIVLSGGQAPGGHNVIAGVYDYIKKCNANSQLFGFLMGPAGIFNHHYIEITDNLMNRYRNQGGFDMIRSGRHKIETAEQKLMSLQIAKKLDLHGLVIVGGDDSNTNAAILAEYFTANDSKVCVIGVPKTIDGDLRNQYVETSFGFDTAIKTYAEFIGNLATDIATSKKYYHFVRLMGRSASNVTLQCALLTRPNLTFIGEEILEKRLSLDNLINELVDMIVRRQELNKDYGIVLVPEGLIEFIPEVRQLIKEINNIVSSGEFNITKLTPDSTHVFHSLPSSIRSQLLLDRDPHGNIQISRIATERLFILLVKEKLQKLGKADHFIPRSHFFGYEGRAGIPSLFDANYCYALGHCAAALVDHKKTGYMAVIRHLDQPINLWMPGGCPLTIMMNIETRNGVDVPVIKKHYVDLNTQPFTLFSEVRDIWKIEDLYCSPGPIQFSGPTANSLNFSIRIPKKTDLLPEKEFGCERGKLRSFFPKSYLQLSPLQQERLSAPITIPAILFNKQTTLYPKGKFDFIDQQTEAGVARSFSLQCRENLNTIYGATITSSIPNIYPERNLRIGVLLNGQQSPGCSNVLIGLWERLCIECPRGKLFGFISGVSGLIASPPHYIEITRDDLSLTRNQGGFELLGREKESEMIISTNAGIEATIKTCNDLKLDGLVLIGGRYTLTGVAILTEEFLRRELKTCVIGIPATQNNNIDTSIIECSLGFDSASKCYSHLIGNLNADGASSAKYWLFVRLMGADKSQITVEAALSTHPNIVLVSEAYSAGDKTLDDVVADIADVIVSRASQNLQFGTVLIPEGLISSLPQFRQLISELKRLFSSLDIKKMREVEQTLVQANDTLLTTDLIHLSPWSRALLKSLPEYFRQQLIQPKILGTLELTKVATEELLADMVSLELRKRERSGICSKLNFMPLCFYFGYQGRSSLPTQFDCSLGLSHGAFAALMIKAQLTGYITSLRGLSASSDQWIPLGYPATAFLRLQSPSDNGTYPSLVPVVPSDMIRLEGKLFKHLMTLQQKWENEEHFTSPGPIQFYGAAAFILNRTLCTEHKSYLDRLAKVQTYLQYIRQLCGSGASDIVLQTSVATLSLLRRLYQKDDI